MCKMPPKIYNNQANWSMRQKNILLLPIFFIFIIVIIKGPCFEPYCKNQANKIWLSSFQSKLVLKENANLETAKKTIFSFK